MIQRSSLLRGMSLSFGITVIFCMGVLHLPIERSILTGLSSAAFYALLTAVFD